MLLDQEAKIDSFETGILCHYCARRLIQQFTPAGTAPYYETGTTTLTDRYGIITSDHRRAQVHGGGKGTYNRVPCCRACNVAKGHGDYHEFYAATAQVRALNQLRETLDILKTHIGHGLIAAGVPVSITEYNKAKRVIKRAAALYAHQINVQAVQHGSL